jgi:stringent starvation protein B
MSVSMTSSRPYLIRAIYEWISDNGQTPYILVNADNPEAVIPRQYIEDGKIVLNINEQAIDNLHIDNDWLLFSARFSGKAMDISIPMTAILAIYAKESGQGMVLDRDNEASEPPPDGSSPGGGTKGGKKPHLQLVK